MEYAFDGGATVPVRVHTVVVSAQHKATVDLEQVRSDIKEHVIKVRLVTSLKSRFVQKVIPATLLDENTKYYLNPCGAFTVGGPQSDAGLTGRKIIVDTYGGWGAHGGGAFSGKDPTKVCSQSSSHFIG